MSNYRDVELSISRVIELSNYRVIDFSISRFLDFRPPILQQLKHRDVNDGALHYQQFLLFHAMERL